MGKEKKPTKGEIQEVINRANNKNPRNAMTQSVINEVAAAAERTRVAILQSVNAEIQALEETLKDAINIEAPEIPTSLLVAIANVKAETTKKAWLGYFGVYHQYGIVPLSAGPESEAKAKIELDVPKGPDALDADEFAKQAADKIAGEIEEKQATDELAAAREKLVKDKEKKH